MTKIFKFTSLQEKENLLRNHLIDYFNTVNQGKVAIPAFILAQQEIDRVKNLGTLNFWYKRLCKAV